VLLRHMAFILQDGFQECIRLYRVFITYLIIFHGFSINVISLLQTLYEGVISA
jgi:hypothetical protein